MWDTFRELKEAIRVAQNMARFIHREWQDCYRRHTHWYWQLTTFTLRLQWIIDNWEGLWQFASQMSKVESQV
jgi:hypothetical protein